MWYDRYNVKLEVGQQVVVAGNMVAYLGRIVRFTQKVVEIKCYYSPTDKVNRLHLTRPHRLIVIDPLPNMPV